MLSSSSAAAAVYFSHFLLGQSLSTVLLDVHQLLMPSIEVWCIQEKSHFCMIYSIILNLNFKEHGYCYVIIRFLFPFCKLNCLICCCCHRHCRHHYHHHQIISHTAKFAKSDYQHYNVSPSTFLHGTACLPPNGFLCYFCYGDFSYCIYMNARWP